MYQKKKYHLAIPLFFITTILFIFSIILLANLGNQPALTGNVIYGIGEESVEIPAEVYEEWRLMFPPEIIGACENALSSIGDPSYDSHRFLEIHEFKIPEEKIIQEEISGNHEFFPNIDQGLGPLNQMLREYQDRQNSEEVGEEVGEEDGGNEEPIEENEAEIIEEEVEEGQTGSNEEEVEGNYFEENEQIGVGVGSPSGGEWKGSSGPAYEDRDSFGIGDLPSWVVERTAPKEIEDDGNYQFVLEIKKETLETFLLVDKAATCITPEVLDLFPSKEGWSAKTTLGKEFDVYSGTLNGGEYGIVERTKGCETGYPRWNYIFLTGGMVTGYSDPGKDPVEDPKDKGSCGTCTNPKDVCLTTNKDSWTEETKRRYSGGNSYSDAACGTPDKCACYYAGPKKLSCGTENWMGIGSGTAPEIAMAKAKCQLGTCPPGMYCDIGKNNNWCFCFPKKTGIETPTYVNPETGRAIPTPFTGGEEKGEEYSFNENLDATIGSEEVEATVFVKIARFFDGLFSSIF